MFRAAETSIMCANYTVYTYSKNQDTSYPLVWSRVEGCPPRLSSEVQPAPHWANRAGEWWRIKRVERRDYPAYSSQPYPGRGNHVIMCEWIRRGSPCISVLIATLTLQFWPALISLIWVFTSHFSHETQTLHRINLLRVEAPQNYTLYQGLPHWQNIPAKHPEGNVFCYHLSSGNDGLFKGHRSLIHSPNIFIERFISARHGARPWAYRSGKGDLVSASWSSQCAREAGY